MKSIAVPFSIALLILAVAFAVAYVRLADVNSLLVVHIDGSRGIDFLGSSADVFGLLAVGGVMIAANAALAIGLSKREHFFSVALAWLSVLLASLLFINLFAILSNN